MASTSQKRTGYDRATKRVINAERTNSRQRRVEFEMRSWGHLQIYNCLKEMTGKRGLPVLAVGREYLGQEQWRA